MTTVYFLRHGAKESGPGDTGLSALGRQQGHALARRLARRQIDAIYCSPSMSTWETGVAVAAAHRLPLLFDARLRERAAWNDPTGQSLADYLAIWQYCNRHRDQAPPGALSSRQAGARVEHLLQDAHDEYTDTGARDAVIFAISHGATIMDFLRNVFPLETLARFNSAVYRNPYSSGVLPEASLTVVHYDGRAYTLSRLGDSDHLARLFQRPYIPQYTPQLAATMAA